MTWLSGRVKLRPGGFADGHSMTDDIQRRVPVTISADDYANANRRHTLKNSLKPIPMLVWLAALAGFGWAIMQQPARAAFGVPSDFFVGALGGFLLLPFLFYFVVSPFTARRTYARQKTLQQPFEFSWSDTGFRTANENGDWKVKWTDFYSWDEDKHVFLFYQSPRLFNILPKRALSEAQIADVRNTVVAARGK